MASLRKPNYPGKLFIVEGIDGSGKSTQLDLLRKWLISEGYLVAFSEWNSSPVVSEATRRGKKQKLLTPTSFSLIHAADFSDRHTRQILPAMEAGAIVLADRYVFTAFARDVARGVPPEWVRDVYAFAAQPTVALYFRVTLEESLKRILVGRPALKYYEAGLDLNLSPDPYESFRLFQDRILKNYEAIVDEYDLTVIDATLPLVKQQEHVRALIKPHLEGAIKINPRAYRQLLAEDSLYGRYIDEIARSRRG